MITTRSRRILAAFLVLFVLMPSSATAVSNSKRRPGTTARKLLARTDLGEWNGTWVYKTRSERILLWIRSGQDGKPEIRLQYVSLSSPESFITDWNGNADYAVTGKPANFHITLDRREANTITGSMEWDLNLAKLRRRRDAEFEMYRGGDGRSLLMNFHTQTLTVTRGEKTATEDSPAAWTFVKASKRHVLWEEVF